MKKLLIIALLIVGCTTPAIYHLGMPTTDFKKQNENVKLYSMDEEIEIYYRREPSGMEPHAIFFFYYFKDGKLIKVVKGKTPPPAQKYKIEIKDGDKY